MFIEDIRWGAMITPIRKFLAVSFIYIVWDETTTLPSVLSVVLYPTLLPHIKVTTKDMERV